MINLIILIIIVIIIIIIVIIIIIIIIKIREFTFDVDVSQLPCGLNGALYFVEMDEDGGASKYPTNKVAMRLCKFVFILCVEVVSFWWGSFRE